MDEADKLVPSAERAIFLIAIPPKSFRHEQHKCLQLQRIIHLSTDSSGLRIRPIFNLEYHRLFATRIIELEHDDVKVAEFHPRKLSFKSGRRGSNGDNTLPANNGEPKPRRHRAFSIDNKVGAHGGRISTHTNYRNLCEMTVTGSERDGHFHFQAADGQAISWTRLHDAPGCQWKLDRENGEDEQSEDETLHPPTTQLNIPGATTKIATKTNSGKPRTSYEFLKEKLDDPSDILAQPRIVRTRTSATMGSQYTTNFANESQLSGLTNSPRIDDGGHLPSGQGEYAKDKEETILSSVPLPHLSVALPGGETPRASMREIRETEDRLYRVLLTALWLTWASDIVHDPDHQVPADLESSNVAPVSAPAPAPGCSVGGGTVPTLADRHSKLGQSEASPLAAASPPAVAAHGGSGAHGGGAGNNNNDGAKKKKKKRRGGGLSGLIARVCGG